MDEKLSFTENDYDYPEDTIPEDLYSEIERNVGIVEKKSKEESNRDINFDDGKFSIPYREVLNKEQFIASVSTEGPMLVIAGAGSGKTRVIVYKVCNLIEKRVSPQSIVLLTFTRKAATEMLDRVKKISGRDDINKVSGGTFHSFASKTLRRFNKQAGIDPTFSIIDTSDAADILAWIKKNDGFDKGQSRTLFPNKNQLQSLISASRNKSVPIQQLIEKEHPKLMDFISQIEKIYEKFQSYKKRANLFDYDDILEVFRNTLRNNDEFLQIIHDRYKYFLVDEYQDTNKVQRDILKLLSGESNNITVVGDDAQSIYAFRGADFQNILSFSKDFPEGRVIKVEKNYRSNQEILDFTNSIINHALMGYKKHLYSDKKGDHKPLISKFYNEEGEAQFIVSKIEELYEQGKKLSDIAVLYRSSWQSNFLQRELLHKKIPFVTVGGIKFIERKHVKDTLSYLKVSQNRKDAPAWTRLLSMITGVGEKTVNSIIDSLIDGESIGEKFKGKKYFDPLASLLGLIEKISEEANIGKKMDLLFSNYFPYLDATEEDSEIRKNDLTSLKKMAESYQNIEEFLNDFSLDPPNQAFQDREVQFDDSGDDCLTLSTIHSAKGLEWHSVFMLHSLDGLMPSHRALHNIMDLEEERRLFYVAATRAKENLFITMPSYSLSFDKYFSYPSRFIAEAKPDTFDFIWE